MNRSDPENPGSVLFRLLRSSTAAWGGFAVYNFLIFYFSLLPGDELPQAFDFHDKFVHGIGYFVLTLIGAHTFFYSRSVFLTAKPSLWSLCWAANVSAITEFIQHFVPGRFTDPADLAANTAGIFAAVFVIRLIREISNGPAGKKGKA